jgi:hypothetical protein
MLSAMTSLALAHATRRRGPALVILLAMALIWYPGLAEIVAIVAVRVRARREVPRGN